MGYFENVTEAAEYLRAKLGNLRPHLGIVLGSGLGAAADAVRNRVIVPYDQIPHFPRSTVEGHTGRLIAGLLGGVQVIVMQGRVHFYEGYSLAEVTFPMRVLGALGISAVVLTNAAGGIAEGYKVGQLVLIADHINMMGSNPLSGPNEHVDGAGDDCGAAHGYRGAWDFLRDQPGSRIGNIPAQPR